LPDRDPFRVRGGLKEQLQAAVRKLEAEPIANLKTRRIKPGDKDWPKLPVPKESEIQRAILEYLALVKVTAWRINQAGVPLHDGSGRFRRGPTRGVSDILGIAQGGRFVAIEVKRRGNRATPDQILFLKRVSDAGGIAVVACSVQDVADALMKGGIGGTTQSQGDTT
jgi:hypothetical protein